MTMDDMVRRYTILTPWQHQKIDSGLAGPKHAGPIVRISYLR
jgi:hypothetical protein